MNSLIILSNFWLRIRDYFIEAFSNLGFTEIIILITGILIGFLLFALLYVLFVFVSFRKKEPKVYKAKANVSNETITVLIDQACLNYKENYTSKKTKEKIDGLKSLSKNLATEVAKTYYPNSEHPMSELSIDEAILLLGYIKERVDELLSGRLIKPFRKYRISQVIKLIETKKKISESKAVKAAEKAHVGKFVKVGRAILNAINPVFWVRKIIVTPTFNLITNKLSDIVLRIVGEETSKVYSKSVLNDNDLTELINEMNSDYTE